MRLGIYRGAVGLVLLIAASLLLDGPLPAEDARVPFAAGERLRYSVSWRLFPAGQAELVVQKDQDPAQWKATATANSTGYVSNIYKVEDEYTSVFRYPRFCSAGIRKVINEGDRHREVNLQFDARRRLALLQDREKNSSTPPKREQFAIPECVQDILSVLYYARTQPMDVGHSFEVPLNDGSRTIHVRVEVQAIEEVQTEIGKFEAIRVEPDVFSGSLFKQKGRMFVWFSKDAHRIPVLLKAQIGIGTIIASLAHVEREEQP